MSPRIKRGKVNQLIVKQLILIWRANLVGFYLKRTSPLRCLCRSRKSFDSFLTGNKEKVFHSRTAGHSRKIDRVSKATVMGKHETTGTRNLKTMTSVQFLGSTRNPGWAGVPSPPPLPHQLSHLSGHPIIKAVSPLNVININ